MQLEAISSTLQEQLWHDADAREQQLRRVITERLSAPRVLGAIAALAVSILIMWTQTANPFLYFQF